MRALLVAAVTPAGEEFWANYYGNGEQDLSGLHVLDPFVGGGTILYEAQRLGAAVTGVDVDPVACAITDFELRAAAAPDPMLGLDEVTRAVGKDLAANYRTSLDGEPRIGLHFFWVQQVTCAGCDEPFDAHPSHLLGVDGTMAWVVCTGCGDVHHQKASLKTLRCGCGHRTTVDAGAAQAGVATCPQCGTVERLIENAQRCGRPEWRLFAIESVPDSDRRRVALTDRRFHKASAEDLARYAGVSAELEAVRAKVPRRLIPRSGRSDERLLRYGYRYYSELFNDRQLLHLVRLAAAIRDVEPGAREGLGLAYSNHTLSNCMLTSYTPKWRQVTPLFVVRSFRHSVRPVEINPWLVSVGRGTFPNSVRKVANARKYVTAPVEFTPAGFVPTPAIPAGAATILNTDSRDLAVLDDNSVDLVVTDPPYLDNIAYSELSDFFVPWLAEVDVLTSRKTTALSDTLAARRRDVADATSFADGLTQVFVEARRVLRDNGRLIFTFQHHSAGAWHAIAAAARAAGFETITVMPMKGDGEKGLHHHDGSSTWDAVFVMRPATPDSTQPVLRGPKHVAKLDSHVTEWADRLHLGAPDVAVLRFATYVAGATGFLATKERSPVALSDFETTQTA